MKILNKLYNILPLEIQPPRAGAKVFFAREFESDFGFTLREILSPTLNHIQTNALEIEANLYVAGKIKQKYETMDKNKENEEVGSSNQPKDSHEQKLDEMTKVIRNLANKLVKMELDNKNPPKKIQQGQNRKFNPQFRIPLLQIMQREKKDQDQLQPLLQIEDEPGEGMEEALKFQENNILLSQEEGEEVHDDALGPESQISLGKEDIEEYYRKYTYLMQA